MTPTPAQIQAFKGALEFENKLDFVIRIDDYEWQVHSKVISQLSRYFDRVCNGKSKEAAEKVVVLHNDCPWMIARMIQFFYFGIYDYDHRFLSHGRSPHTSPPLFQSSCFPPAVGLRKFMAKNPTGKQHEDLPTVDKNRSRIEIAAMMHQIAEKYDIPELRTITIHELLTGEFKNEDDFFTVLNILTLKTLHKESYLLRYMLGCINEDYAAKPAEYPRLNSLVETDSVVTMSLIRSLQAECRELKSRVSGSAGGRSGSDNDRWSYHGVRE